MKNSAKPIIGISMGDPGGIGPEICVKTLATNEIYELCQPVVVGDAAILRNAVRFCGKNLNINSITQVNKGIFQIGTFKYFNISSPL